MKYSIYQLDSKNLNVICDHKLFESWSMLNRTAGFNMKQYKKVYDGDVDFVDNTNDTLDILFQKFNVCRPEDYHARSLSVSDVVELDGKKYYCDEYGWVEV